MYNFLKYKHNWKKCVHCGNKTKKISKEYRRCIFCKGEVSKYFMRRIPKKRKYNLIKGIKNYVRKGEEWSEY